MRVNIKKKEEAIDESKLIYDSSSDTISHIEKVKNYLKKFSDAIFSRGISHDNTKLIKPEKPYFDKYTPLLKDLVYGSDEYKDALTKIKPALEHHYSVNRHHPEYFENGIDGMNLIDLVEMLCDWKASSERNKDDDILKSIEINADRFNMSEQLKSILINSAKEMFDV